MGRGSEGLCRPQVRRCEPSVLPEPVWLLPLVWVRLGGGGGTLLQEYPRGFAGVFSTPVPSLFLPSMGAPCMPVACSAQAGGLLEPLSSAPASPDGYPGTAVWMQPSPASTSSICSLLRHDPWQWSRQGTTAVAGRVQDPRGFRTKYSNLCRAPISHNVGRTGVRTRPGG